MEIKEMKMATNPVRSILDGLIVLFILLIVGAIIYYFHEKKIINAQLAKNKIDISASDKIISDQQKQLDQYKKDNAALQTKVYTQTQIASMSEQQKEQLIVDLQNDKAKLLDENNNLIVINEDDIAKLKQLTDDLAKTSALVKKDKRILIQGIAGIGTNQNLNLQTEEGALVSAVLFHNLITIGGGGSVSQETYTILNKTIVGGKLIFTVGVML
jgi:hypothetical protein